MKTYKRNKNCQLTIAILKFLSKQKEPLSGHAIANEFNIPYGTMMGFLVTLEDEGMVEIVGNHFIMTMGMALFGARFRARLESEAARIERQLDALKIR